MRDQRANPPTNLSLFDTSPLASPTPAEPPLREHNVALALTDHSYMPRPWECPKPQDLITADFVYVRWLGDRSAIEAVTTTWDQTVVDRRDDLLHWVELFRELRHRNLQVYAYANNHYAGHGPGTVKLFWDLYEQKT